MAIYAFDGTWNNSSAPEELRDPKLDTNVHRFCQHYAEQNKKYLDGVGCRGGMIGKLIGGATGAGAQRRLAEMFDALIRHFVGGDEVIDIVGYSRGAAIARMFVQRIEHDFSQLKRSSGGWLTEPPPIRFLGLFDTVASFGIPWTESELGFLPDIPEIVENTFHAMALDEIRETFGLERCRGNRSKITEVWFRGSHGDIGGNATYTKHGETVSNRQRSDIALNWMLSKAEACGIKIVHGDNQDSQWRPNVEAPVTLNSELIKIGTVGTQSRRIHVGDLVHHTLEQTELTRGIDGRLLRRIDVATRIEDAQLEASREVQFWIPPAETIEQKGNTGLFALGPSLVELSSRRYPFDIPPARTWSAWLLRWGLENPGIDPEQLSLFWSPTEQDRSLAWDLIVELQTRITTQDLHDDEGNDHTALESVYKLFPNSRDYMHKHGLHSANAGTLITAYLNQKIRRFTAKWHQPSIEENWKSGHGHSHNEFRKDLKTLQPTLRKLASALSDLAGVKLTSSKKEQELDK